MVSTEDRRNVLARFRARRAKYCKLPTIGAQRYANDVLIAIDALEFLLLLDIPKKEEEKNGR